MPEGRARPVPAVRLGRRAAPVAVIAVLALGLPLAGAVPATAAEVSPGSGALPAFREAPDLGPLAVTTDPARLGSEPLTVRRADAAGQAVAPLCPAPASVVGAYLRGPSVAWVDPARPVAAVAPVPAPATPELRLDTDLPGLALAAGLVTVPGRYRLVVQCGDGGLATVQGQWTVALRLGTDGSWQATDPAGAVAPGPTGTTPPATTSPPTTTSSPATTSVRSAPVPSASSTAPATPPTTPAAVTTADPAASTSVVTAPAARSRAVGSSAVTTSPAAPAESTSSTSTGPAPGARVGPDVAGVSALAVAAAEEKDLGGLVVEPYGGDPVASGAVKVKPADGAGCPSGTVAFQAYLVGPAPWPQTPWDFSTTIFGAGGEVLQTKAFATAAGEQGVIMAPGKYTISVVCFADGDLVESLGRFSGNVWFIDANRWQAKDPATSQTTTTTVMTTDPLVRIELGTSARLVATVLPATAPGSVRLLRADNSGGLGDYPAEGQSTVPVTGGTASRTVSDLTVGLYFFAARFVPTDPARFTPSETGLTMLAVVPPMPPEPTSAATLSGTPEVGQALTCTAAFTGGTASWAWIQDYDTLLEGTERQYTVTEEDLGHTITCRASATNAGGTISRTSAPVQVPA